MVATVATNSKPVSNLKNIANLTKLSYSDIIHPQPAEHGSWWRLPDDRVHKSHRHHRGAQCQGDGARLRKSLNVGFFWTFLWHFGFFLGTPPIPLFRQKVRWQSPFLGRSLVIGLLGEGEGTIREAPFWKVLVLYGHCPNSFRRPPKPIWKQHISKRGFTYPHPHAAPHNR